MELPKDFIASTRSLMNEKFFNELSDALSTDATTSIRLNPKKTKINPSEITLYDGIVPWCNEGVYLKERPNFTFDPLFHCGCYYVQEASSMFLDVVIKQFVKEPATMLDLCAAPGGKSTVARSSLPKGSLLVSNEPIRNRAQILSENIQKYGDPDTIVTNNYPSDFQQLGNIFDIILADVPCSGEGMFRKDETAIKEWSLQNVDMCQKRQQDIVRDIWECLKDDGLFIYSTCTFNTKENEENIRWICDNLGAEVMPVDINGDWGITGSLLNGFNEPVYRFLPCRTRGEGLFMAVLRKNAKNSKTTRQFKNVKHNAIHNEWIKEKEMYDTIQKGNFLISIKKEFTPFYDAADKKLSILSAGIKIGEIKGKDIIPDQSLAFSTAFNGDMFPKVEITYEQAIAFLRKEAVALPSDTPKGFISVTYKGFILGFEKNIGNRANNLYPPEWRIRSSHIPDKNNNIII